MNGASDDRSNVLWISQQAAGDLKKLEKNRVRPFMEEGIKGIQRSR